MDVLVAESHGQIGQRVTELLAGQGHEVRGMVRKHDQASTVQALGAEAVVADLTAAVGHAVRGCAAVLFGAGSGGEDVWGVGRDGAIGLIDAAEAGADRFVLVSSSNADAPEQGPDPLREYLQAKRG